MLTETHALTPGNPNRSLFQMNKSQVRSTCNSDHEVVAGDGADSPSASRCLA